LVFAGWLLLACDDGVLRAFEPHAPVVGGGGGAPIAGAGGGGGGTTSVDPAAGTGNAGPSSPLLIDDFEDGDSRAEEPLGWWYPVNDKTGTQGFGIEPVSRGTASVYALRTYGSGFQSWGAALGVNLIGEAAPLRAQSSEQLCFEARVDADTSNAIEVHFLVEGDEQHYVQSVLLSETWARYCLPLSDFSDLNGAVLVPNALIALQLFFPSGSPFALSLDDVSIGR
jgi:hypothetical protein